MAKNKQTLDLSQAIAEIKRFQTQVYRTDVRIASLHTHIGEFRDTTKSLNRVMLTTHGRFKAMNDNARDFNTALSALAKSVTKQVTALDAANDKLQRQINLLHQTREASTSVSVAMDKSTAAYLGYASKANQQSGAFLGLMNKGVASVSGEIDKATAAYLGLQTQVEKTSGAFLGLMGNGTASVAGATDKNTAAYLGLKERVEVAKATRSAYWDMAEAERNATTTTQNLNAATAVTNDQLLRTTRILLHAGMITALYRLVSALTHSAEQATEFSIRISEIRTISDRSAMSVDMWSRSLVNLSNSYGVTATESAEAAYQALSNQVTKATNTTAFMREEVMLSVTAVSTLDEAVGATTAILNAFNMNISQTTEVNAILFKTVELGRIRLEEMSDSIGRVSILSNQLGVSFVEQQAALSMLTIQGVRADEALTLIRNVLLKLIKPGERMKEIFEEWGVTSGEAAIRVYGLGSVIERLSYEARKSGDEAQEMGEIFDRLRALVGAVGLSQGKLNEEMAKYQSAAADYKAAQEEAMSSVGRQVKIQMEKIKNYFLVEWGLSLNKAFLSISKAVGGADNLIRILLKTIKIGTSLWIGHAIAVRLVASNYLTTVFNIVRLSGVVRGLQVGIQLLTTKMWAAVAAQSALTLGLTLGIAVLTNAITSYVFAGEKIVKTSVDIANDYAEQLQAMTEASNEFLENQAKQRTEQIESVLHSWDMVLTEFQRDVNKLNVSLEDAFKSLDKKFKSLSSEAIKPAAEAVKDLEKKLKELEAALASKDKDIFKRGVDLEIERRMTSVSDIAKERLDAEKESAKRAIEYVKERRKAFAARGDFSGVGESKALLGKMEAEYTAKYGNERIAQLKEEARWLNEIYVKYTEKAAAESDAERRGVYSEAALDMLDKYRDKLGEIKKAGEEAIETSKRLTTYEYDAVRGKYGRRTTTTKVKTATDPDAVKFADEAMTAAAKAELEFKEYILEADRGEVKALEASRAATADLVAETTKAADEVTRLKEEYDRIVESIKAVTVETENAAASVAASATRLSEIQSRFKELGIDTKEVDATVLAANQKEDLLNLQTHAKAAAEYNKTLTENIKLQREQQEAAVKARQEAGAAITEGFQTTSTDLIARTEEYIKELQRRIVFIARSEVNPDQKQIRGLQERQTEMKRLLDLTKANLESVTTPEGVIGQPLETLGKLRELTLALPENTNKLYENVMAYANAQERIKEATTALEAYNTELNRPEIQERLRAAEEAFAEARKKSTVDMLPALRETVQLLQEQLDLAKQAKDSLILSGVLKETTARLTTYDFDAVSGKYRRHTTTTKVKTPTSADAVEAATAALEAANRAEEDLAIAKEKEETVKRLRDEYNSLLEDTKSMAPDTEMASAWVDDYVKKMIAIRDQLKAAGIDTAGMEPGIQASEQKRDLLLLYEHAKAANEYNKTLRERIKLERERQVGASTAITHAIAKRDELAKNTLVGVVASLEDAVKQAEAEVDRRSGAFAGVTPAEVAESRRVFQFYQAERDKRKAELEYFKSLLETADPLTDEEMRRIFEMNAAARREYTAILETLANSRIAFNEATDALEAYNTELNRPEIQERLAKAEEALAEARRRSTVDTLPALRETIKLLEREIELAKQAKADLVASGVLKENFGGVIHRAFGGQGTDRIHAMLSPGERVMSRAVSDRFGPLLDALSGSTSVNRALGGNVTMGDINITVPPATSEEQVNAIVSGLRRQARMGLLKL